MKKYSYHDKHHKVILFQAIVFTLLFHIALLCTFAYKKPKEPIKKYGKQIVMFNLANNDSQQSRAMTRWLELHDPSLIARPDEIHGYGSIAKRMKMRSPIQPLPIKIKPALIIPAPYKFEFLRSPNKLTIDKNSRLVDYSTLSVPSRNFATPLPIAKRTYPIVKLSTGKYIDGILTAKEIEKYKLGSEKKIGVTRVQIFFNAPGIMPRIITKNSCGMIELDQLAIRKLILNQDKLIKNQFNSGMTLFADINWSEVKR